MRAATVACGSSRLDPQALSDDPAGPAHTRHGVRSPRDPKLEAFASELEQWSRGMNLVGSNDPAAIREHIEDSLAAAEHLPQGARVVDLGSGAGFPGVPICIARTDLEVCLVEIREKRVHFLRHVARTLELGCRVERRRIEEPLDDPFDLALLRAVTAPEEAIEIARPWVASGGEIWVWAGPNASIPIERELGRISLGVRGAIIRASA